MVCKLIFLDKSCPKHYFICGNGKCLKPTEICNGRDDCGDNSDESTICSGNLWNTYLIVAYQFNFKI